MIISDLNNISLIIHNIVYLLKMNFYYNSCNIYIIFIIINRQHLMGNIIR